MVTIFAGIPGAGKSHLVRQRHAHAWVVSADHYFTNEAGVYRFDPKRINEAHAACFRSYLEALAEAPVDEIVVDNTNTTPVELAPYILGARAFGHEPEIRVLRCPVEVAVRRCVHGVPEASLRRMAAQLEDTLRAWPRFWPAPIVLDSPP